MSLEALVAVLAETRALLALPDNDYTWSRWHDQPEALSEIDGLIGQIEHDGAIPRAELDTLFAPTASLQEVSISSGWGGLFLDLAMRYDAAVADL